MVDGTLGTGLSVAQALHQAAALGLDRFDAQVLLRALLERDRAWLISHDDALMTPEQTARWRDWLTRRQAGEPVAYLTGSRGFHGLMLQVTPAVLDPRPDTETLVDWALDLMDHAPRPGHVLDLGTGSGAIALALKAAHPDWQVCAVDRSPAALAVARANGARLGLAIDWREGSWFEALGDARSSSAAPARFDLIVSNPPYIAEDDPHLAALRAEPREALVAGADGLDDLRYLIAQAPQHLHAGGWLLLEHGHDQASAVARLFSTDSWAGIDHRRDLGGHQRCTGARVCGTGPRSEGSPPGPTRTPQAR